MSSDIGEGTVVCVVTGGGLLDRSEVVVGLDVVNVLSDVSSWVASALVVLVWSARGSMVVVDSVVSIILQPGVICKIHSKPQYFNIHGSDCRVLAYTLYSCRHH